MLRALEILADIRRRGAKPAFVMLDAGGTVQRKWWAEDVKTISITVPDSEPLRDLDFRPLVGCDVVMVAMSPDQQRMRDVAALVCAQASIVTVLNCNGDPDNLGHEWVRGKGWHKFGGAF